MDISVAPGSYVVAVSGGVDSMTLLHMLRKLPGLKLTVAHFDHGIRSDSKKDRQFVQETARVMGLPFVYHEGKLGLGASEATARKARYEFLHKTRHASGAAHIMTGHHQDDLLETVILNLIRGTGYKGLSPMHNNLRVLRPLLGVSKAQLLDYAKVQGIRWREDPTNTDTRYLRNYVRQSILPLFDDESRKLLLKYVRQSAETNQKIDQQLTHYLHLQPDIRMLDRYTFIMLPHSVAKEIMVGWLRNVGISGVDRPMIERLVIAAKTYVPGKSADINGQHLLRFTSENIVLKSRA